MAITRSARRSSRLAVRSLRTATADVHAILDPIRLAASVPQAASILARDGFVKGLAKLEKDIAMKLPKGASAAVDAAAKQFVEERGASELEKISKLHFRTALRAQGLPEPPKTEWRKQ